MADKPTEKPEAAAPVASAEQAPVPDATAGKQPLSGKEESKPEGEVAKDSAVTSEGELHRANTTHFAHFVSAEEHQLLQPCGLAPPHFAPIDEHRANSSRELEPKEPANADKSADNATGKTEKEQEKPAADGDVEMKEAAEDAAPEAEAEAAPPAAAAATPASKAKGGRRKSAAGESKAKALNRKGSKARLTHTDAQPGDHFLVKLKGFPAWPAIICDESMLPQALIISRPVSAARQDGTYAEAYADGGKRVHDRSFPVMYLYTNEFGWVQNTALSELTAEKAKDTITEKMRKDLKAAFELAAEHNAVEHYKEILKNFQEEQLAQEQAKLEAAVTPKKSTKGKGKPADEDEDADMEDADTAPKSTKSKKRKAEDDTSTPQRPDSVKKPKIKLNTSSTPKTANGAATPKSAGASTAKSAKAKPKKAKEGGEKKSEAPKEAKMTAEELHARKKKEVLYLRHKLQRGLLTREQQPQENEMKPMSEFITMLENFVDLEVSIIRGTKINKVLKAILKLDSIPREEEFQFKKRSQTLLDKWNKLLAGDGSAPPSASTNGVNGAGEEKKSGPNGVKEEAGEPKKAEPEKATEPKAEDSAAKEKSAETPDTAEAKVEKPATEATTASEPVAAAN
ncbi:PWWP domain-containing protein 3 [Tolypocladium paradoxum]|uniref:PWWP domain-containing protein 3 n=1 Tax=Tolypocladium paradoxum TaxID=94208 RepID=A0A2S4KNU2_9HYPO|nr:PWWP domain-containing protein 3 [Tolypocladium paradoxum]